MDHASPPRNPNIHKALVAMHDVYGPVSALSPTEAQSWTPPPASSGHLGRYLWTDAFGVVNFITLYHFTSSIIYLHCAARLIETVHNVLGKTRSQDAYLPGASAEHPLAGGLRIGKDEETGPDGDGQYHHYLTLWMFALNRMSIASGEKKYNDLAIELAQAIHPAFVVHRDSARPHMRWKMSMDLSQPLVPNEGNLDPIDGYVVFRLLQESSGDPHILEKEIADYKKIVDAKYLGATSDDPLDLGMTLWTSHWFADEEKWAETLMNRALSDIRQLAFVNRYFDHQLKKRLAFREFGTSLGIRVVFPSAEDEDDDLPSLAHDIIKQWENAGVGSPSRGSATDAEMQKYGSKPISLVMYAAAVLPGAFRKDFLDD